MDEDQVRGFEPSDDDTSPEVTTIRGTSVGTDPGPPPDDDEVVVLDDDGQRAERAVEDGVATGHVDSWWVVG